MMEFMRSMTNLKRLTMPRGVNSLVLPSPVINFKFQVTIEKKSKVPP
jgi:hypothetical protein